MNVRVPADVEIPDRIVGGLTARQIAVLGGHGLVIWALYAALAGRVPVAMIGALAMPVAVLGAAWTWGKPEGTSFERLAVAAARHLRSPRRKVAAPEGLAALPRWAGAQAGVGEIDAPVAQPTADGLLDLAGPGSVAVCFASSLNFALRSEEEQRALIDGLGRMLNAIDQPVQFVVRSERTDLRALTESLEERARSLPHRLLEQAAIEHAAFLRSLAERRDILSRRASVCFRDLAPAEAEGTAARVAHRVEEAAALLRGIGIKLARHSAQELAGLLARAADPETPTRCTSSSDEIVVGAA